MGTHEPRFVSGVDVIGDIGHVFFRIVVFNRKKISCNHVKALDSNIKDVGTFLNLGTHWAKM